MERLLVPAFLVFFSGVASAISVGGYITHPACAYATGAIDAQVSGGTPPYTYSWSDGPVTEDRTGLVVGSYTLTVTDALSAQASHQFDLVSVGLDVQQAMTWVYDNNAAHHPCPGQQNGSITIAPPGLGGVAPYNGTININGVDSPPLGFDMNYGNPYFGYFGVTDNVYLTITDANGCSGSGTVLIDSPQLLNATASNVNPSCGTQANGSTDITFGFAGPYGPSLFIYRQYSGDVVYNETPLAEPLALTGLQAGVYTIDREYSTTYFPGGCGFLDDFTIPDLGPDCGTVHGHVYIDNNQDCAQQGGEVSVPYRLIEIQPGPEYAITDGGGNYTRNVLNGAHTLQAIGTGTELYPICPAVQPVPFTMNYNSSTIDLADSSLIPLDLMLTAYADVARPGFAQVIWGTVRNLSAQISGAVTLSMTFDAQISYTGASPVPTSVAGNTLTWDLPALIAFGSVDFWVQLQVPPGAGLIGQSFTHSLSASQPLAEATLVNNAATISGVFQGSYDPNDKQAITSTGAINGTYVIDQDEWIDYVIRFQNTGTDTAFNVVVTDTLPATLDLSTFEQATASHPFAVSFRSGRAMEWRFDDILLPDSGTNEAASHGLVSFRIRPSLPLLPGTTIENAANIYFDFNEPVITEPSVLTAEFSTDVHEQGQGRLRLYPNPVNDLLQVALPADALVLRIRANDGREVITRSGQAGRSVFGVQGLPSGAYLMEVITAGGDVHRARFIKQ